MKKEEFLEQIEGCILPEMFDQRLLDHAAEMFGRWGKSTHMNEKEHLFESFGLASKTDDNNDIKMQKIALRFVCTRMMEANLNRKDAADLIRIGAYVPGTDPKLDAARNAQPAIEALLRQATDERVSRAEAVAALLRMAGRPA